MDIQSLAQDRLRQPTAIATRPSPASLELPSKPSATALASSSGSPDELQEAFQDFVGQTLFGSMLASMRKTLGKPAYMHGGRAEEVFQKQLDQHIVEDLTDASAQTISDPMYELFNMQRQN